MTDDPEPTATGKSSRDLIAGRYRLGARLGGGGMGVVWRAKDETLGRTVAVKELLIRSAGDGTRADEAVRRAMREARIAARLHHANVIGVYDVVEYENRPWLVMEYLDSRSLAQVLVDDVSLSVRETARLGERLAAGLTAAHDAGVVHRDVKPGNVLLAADGTVKLTDFGISRAVGDTTVTGTGVLLGTVSYMAPEVALGQSADSRSDVYALGATLYAAVEGAPPSGTGDNAIALLYRIAHEPVEPPRQAGPLTEILMWMLARDPDHRPTMPQVRSLLEEIADAEEDPAVPAGGAPDGATDRTVESASGAGAGTAGKAAASRAAAAAADLTVYDRNAAVIRVAPTLPEELPVAAAPDAHAVTSASVLDGGGQPTSEQRVEATPPPTAGSVGIVGSSASTRSGAKAGSDAAAGSNAAAGSSAAEASGLAEASGTAEPAGPGSSPSAPAASDSGTPADPDPAAPGGSDPGSGSSPAPGINRRRRGVLIAAAVAAIAVLTAGSVLLTQNSGDAASVSGTHHTATSSHHPTPSPAKPSQTPKSATPTVTASTSASASASTSGAGSGSASPSVTQQLESTITNYYKLMPNDLSAGWGWMTADYQQNHAGGMSGYTSFWDKIASVSLSDVTATPPDTVVATIRYVYKNGSIVVERTSFGLVQQGGQWKIASSSVLS